MADKTLRINISADTSGFVSLTKGLEGITKTAEGVKAAVTSLTERLDVIRNKVAEYASLQGKEYQNLQSKLTVYNDLVQAGLRSEVIARGNAQASITKYNLELAKTVAEYQRLNNAINLSTNAISKDNRGYTANAGAEAARKRQLEEYTLVAQKLSITRELENRQLARHIAYENELKQQQIQNISNSVAQQAAARSREDNLHKKDLADLRKYIEDKAALERKAASDSLISGMSRGAKFGANSLVEGMSSAGANASTQAIHANTQAVKANGTALQETERHTRNLFIRVGEAIGSYRIWNAAINLVTNSLRAIPNIGIELESTRASLTATTGSAANMASTMFALHDEAVRTGVAISVLRESFRGFQASTSLAGASIESTWKMFTNLNTVITGLHLPIDKANGIFLAMAQIFNKGKVQSEELVKQLGNLLPGAFASMAASMGISGQELSKRMKAGVVLARDVMEEFTNFYAKRFAPAFNLAAEGLNANIGRLKTAFTELGETLYSKTSSGMTAVVKGITSLANYINEAITNGNALSQVFSTSLNIALAATVGVLYQISAGFVATNAALFTTAGAVDLATAAMVRLEAAVAFITKPAALIAGFYLLAQEMAKFGDNADSALDAVKKTIAESKRLQELPQNPNSLEYKVANDPEVKKVTAEYERLNKVINETQDKINGKNFQLWDNLQLLTAKQKEQKAALEALLPILDNLKEKAKITINMQVDEAISDISKIAREMEIAFKRASGDTIGAAKLVFEDQHREDLAELKAVVAKGSQLVIPTKLSEIELSKFKAQSSTIEEERAKAQSQVDNYNMAVKAIEQYEYALAHAGETSKKTNKDAKDFLAESKLILKDRLDAVDSAAKAEGLIANEELSKLEALRANNLITEYEYLAKRNEAYENNYVKQNNRVKEKIALVEQEMAVVAKSLQEVPTTPKTPALNSDELELLTSYNTALEKNTIVRKGNIVEFEAWNNGQLVSVDIAKAVIDELALQDKASRKVADSTILQAKSEDQLRNAKARSIELGIQLRTLKEDETKLAAEEAIRVRASSVEIQAIALKELETQISKYRELTSSAREFYEWKLRTLGLPEAKIQPIMVEFDKVAKKEEESKKYEELRQSLEAYSSSLDTATEKAAKFGDIQSAIFDGSLGGINTMVGAFETMAKAIGENTKELDKLNAKRLEADKFQPDASKGITAEYIKAVKLKAGLSEKFDREEKELYGQRLQMELRGARQMSESASKMFGEKTAAGQAFHNISTALAVAEMALEAKKVAVYIAGILPKLAAGAATMFAQSGWGGFAGVAAMAAVMVGLGVNYATSGGKEAPPPVSPDTGTVLGNANAKSESLTNVATLLEDIHAKEYRELRGINNGISTLNEAITETITKIFQAGGLPGINLGSAKLTGIAGGLTAIDPINRAGFDPIGKAILGFLFGGKQTQTIVAQGIATGFNKIGDILGGERFFASYFADIETKTKGGIFGKDKTSFERVFQQMDKDTYTAITRVFKVIGTTMFDVAETLGEGLGDRVKNYVIPAMMIDLKGLTGEDAAKKMNSVISAMLDTMASNVFGDIIGQYQQLGEGMLETAIRIVAEVAVVKDALGMSGIVLKDNAIAISDALVQAAGGLKEFQAQFESYYDKFYTNAEKQSRLFKKLSEAFQDADSILPETRKKYRQLLEGLDLTNEADQTRYSLLLSLSEAADTYYEAIERGKDTYFAAFHTDIENQKRLHDQLATALSGVNTQLPATRAGYRQLVEGLDLTNKKDRERYFLLLELSSAADSYYQTLEAISAQATKDIEAAKEAKLAKKISKTDAAFNAYEKQLKAQLDATLKSIEAQKKVAQDIVSKWNTLLTKLASAKESTVVDTLETTRLKRLVAEAIISTAAATARAGGNVNIDGLDIALAEIAKPSENLYSSFADYALAQARTGNNIEDLNKHATGQKTLAEQTLETLDASAKDAQEYYTASIDAAKAQIDAMRGLNTSIQDLSTAIRKEGDVRANIPPKAASDLDIYNAYKANTGLDISPERFVHFQELAAKGMTTQEIYDRIAGNRDTRIAKLFQETVGQQITQKKLEKYMKLFEAGSTLDDILALIKASPIYLNSHASGLERVPFDGYQATLHKDESVIDAQSVNAIQRYFRVTPNNSTNNVISEELLAELKLLRKTVEDQGKKLESIDKNSKSSADTLDRSSAGGPLLVQVV